MAHAWEDAHGLPRDVFDLFRTAAAERLRRIELLLAFPEYHVHLPGGGHASQCDVFALARLPDGLIAITVEGKVSEPFDKTVAEWSRRPSPGKQKRLQFLADKLGVGVHELGPLRYQLVHRAACALIEAQRFHARDAALVVQWFGESDAEPPSFKDYAGFLALFGYEAKRGLLIPVGKRSGIELHIGWSTGDSKFLRS
jgi:hypothetical protein